MKRERECGVRTIVAATGCDCEIIEDAKSVALIMDRYKGLLAQGKTSGFVPIIVIPSRMMSEVLDREQAQSYSEEDLSVEAVSARSDPLSGQDILKDRLTMNEPEDGDDEHDHIGSFVAGKPTHRFEALTDFSTGRVVKEAIIAKIPTDKPWEAAAWFPMGGFNDCPVPEEQVAVFRYWYEKYGAVPALVTHEIWELYVENPIETEEAAKVAAMEQYAFAGDIVWQGVGTVNALAGTLLNSTVWCFWWD